MKNVKIVYTISIKFRTTIQITASMSKLSREKNLIFLEGLFWKDLQFSFFFSFSISINLFKDLLFSKPQPLSQPEPRFKDRPLDFLSFFTTVIFT